MPLPSDEALLGALCLPWCSSSTQLPVWHWFISRMPGYPKVEWAGPTAGPITRAREVPFLGHSWTVVYHTPAAWGVAFAAV